MIAESIFEYALTILKGLGNLEASLKVGQALATSRACPKWALFVLRIELPRDGLRLIFVS